MTFCGFSVGDGVAWAWADSETYIDGEPLPQDYRKIGIGDGLAIVGAGWHAINEEVRALAEGLNDVPFARAAAILQSTARKAASDKRAYHEVRGERYSAESKFGIVGVYGGRLSGFSMDEEDGFLLREVDSWGSPPFDGRPTCAEDVRAIAMRQLEIVKTWFPRASGRALCVAKVGPRGVATAEIRLPRRAA
jgi:hypothetical protein